MSVDNLLARTVRDQFLNGSPKLSPTSHPNSCRDAHVDLDSVCYF